MRMNNTPQICNICNSEEDSDDKFYSWGFHSTKMRTDDYEKLIVVGYQRSGVWFYKPDIKQTCCPPYTPRLDITEFKISKSQK